MVMIWLGSVKGLGIVVLVICHDISILNSFDVGFARLLSILPGHAFALKRKYKDRTCRGYHYNSTRHPYGT